jgi:FtsH-binding integral membrane protein
MAMAGALSWVMQVIAAAIFAQTLFFKFTGAEESRWIFSQLGVEPWGRLIAGVSELAVVVLLLIPKTSAIGAVMGLGVISGAIFSHLFVLGIAVKGDGGFLFVLALIVFGCCAGVAWIRRADIPFIGDRLAARPLAAGTVASPR